MKVYVETYGCQMNEYDSELIIAVLELHGYEVVEKPEQAQIVMLNTCSVREGATRKIYGRVHDLRHKINDPNLVIGILGCMATDGKENLIENKKLPIDFIAGPDSYRRLPQVIEDVLKSGERQMDIRLDKAENYEGIQPMRGAGVNAWIAIMRGCNNFCSFCIVPYTRGRERSRAVDSIVQETRILADQGYKQVTLLGQNVNSYQHEQSDFADLLHRVSEVDGIERIRFTSPHPKDFPTNLIEVMAEHPKICKHIHLPLQAGNSRVLDVMRRTYSKDEYLRLVDDIRSAMPDIALSTDVIVGFPTETATEFEDTVDVMQQVQFDSAFIFKYSVREGTLAAKHFEDDVSEAEKTERIVRLNEMQKAISLKKNQAHIGRIEKILIEHTGTKKNPDEMQGRNDGNTLVILPPGDYQVRDFVNAEIVDASPNVLRGVGCKPN